MPDATILGMPLADLSSADLRVIAKVSMGELHRRDCEGLAGRSDDEQPDGGAVRARGGEPDLNLNAEGGTVNPHGEAPQRWQPAASAGGILTGTMTAEQLEAASLSFSKAAADAGRVWVFDGPPADDVAIKVKFTVPGFHRWADAPAHRDYLAARHRHLFGVEVLLDVTHDDRDVEFHDLLEEARRFFDRFADDAGSGDYEFHGLSCESIARQLRAHVMRVWPDRACVVSVSEDDEVGAEVGHL